MTDRSMRLSPTGAASSLNAGTLIEAATPNEVIGVLAHESGHIAGGHLSKMREQLATATNLNRSSGS